MTLTQRAIKKQIEKFARLNVFQTRLAHGIFHTMLSDAAVARLTLVVVGSAFCGSASRRRRPGAGAGVSFAESTRVCLYGRLVLPDGKRREQTCITKTMLETRSEMK